MGRMLSLHEYDLREGVTEEMAIDAFRRAEAEGLFRLPGLRRYALLTGIKGTRRGALAALWEYESRQAWEALWGPPDRPFERQDFPEAWRRWEDEFLAPLLRGKPDRIHFTAYETCIDSERP